MQRSWFLALGVGVIMFWGSGSASADFATATRPPFSPESGKSINGMDLSEVKAKVQPIWDAIVFEKNGKPIEYIATIETDAGTMKAKFYPDVAPNHARNFIALSKIGFYDGLKFHRVVPDFMIQGGCPKGNGTGGPGYCVKQEFNKKPHKKGVLSMARASNVDSAGCQFFVCHGNPSFLDNQYTAFGELVDGFDVLDKIATAPRSGQETPVTPVVIKKITISEGE